jgi:hypothetical protein
MMKYLALAAAAAVVPAVPASAGVAFALRERAQFATDLIMLDTNDPGGTGQLIGATGVVGTRLSGLAMVGSTLYAYGENRTVADGQGGLYRIDTTTGAATWIGGSNLGGHVVRDLAYNPADGQLYGLAVVTGNNTNFADMITVDTRTGEVTSRRNIWGTVGIQMTALAAAADGTFYGVDNVQDALWSMTLNNVNRYDADRIGTGLGGPSIVSDQGFAIDWRNGDAAVLAANGSTNGFNAFRSVDLASGGSAVIGTLPFSTFFSQTDITDLTFIPTPGGAFAIGVAALAVCRRRR